MSSRSSATERGRHHGELSHANTPAAPGPRPRRLSGRWRLWGDRIAFFTGIVLALGLLGFFSWKMDALIERDRGLVAVPYSTPTPPPPPPRR